MEYKKISDHYIVRIDKGEEVITILKSLCEKEHILLGSIYGIGATNEIEIGLFDITTKVYHSQVLTQPLEIISLLGNITQKEGEVYLHIHASVADSDGRVYGGHLSKCIISATCEIILTVIPGSVFRKFDEEIGLNLLEYEDR